MEIQNQQNGVVKERARGNAKYDEVEENILALFDERAKDGEERGFKSQKEIIEALKERGIKTSQTMVSRILSDLHFEQDEDGHWLNEEVQYKNNLNILEDLFEAAAGSPRLYSNLEMVLLRTTPGYNVLIAKQLAKTFKEVKATFCPNESDIIIYYKRQRKQSRNLEETVSEGDEAQPTPNEAAYAKSRMRVEVVRLCKKIREKIG